MFGEHVPIKSHITKIFFLNMRREPIFVFEFDAALFAFEYATPPFVFDEL
jgi:hypothetical protein